MLFTGPKAHGEAAPAPASERSVDGAIEVVKGATCLDEKRLEAHVRAWLGRGRVPPGVRVFVRGDAVNPRVIEFKIAREGKIRQRRFDPAPATCDEMHAAVGLSIALSIDAGVLQRMLERGLDAEEPPRLLAVEIGAGAGAIPGLSLGGATGIEYGWLRWFSARADVFGQYSWNNRVNGTSGNFDATVLAVSLHACGGGRFSRSFRVAFCAGAAGGVLHTRGHGFTVSHADTGAWITALSGVRFEVLAGIPWVLDADVVSPLWVPAIRVEQPGGTDHFRDPTIAGLLVTLGPAFEF